MQFSCANVEFREERVFQPLWMMWRAYSALSRAEMLSVESRDALCGDQRYSLWRAEVLSVESRALLCEVQSCPVGNSGRVGGIVLTPPRVQNTQSCRVSRQVICCACRRDICCVCRQDICCVSRQDIFDLPRHPNDIEKIAAARLCCQWSWDVLGDRRCLVC